VDLALEVLSEVLVLGVEVALALAAEDVALEHSLAACPVHPQKRQRFWSKHLLRSSGMSLLSLPNFDVRLDFFGDEKLPELVLEFPPELVLELLDLLFEFRDFLLSLLEFELDLPLSLERSVLPGVSQATSERCSQ